MLRASLDLNEHPSDILQDAPVVPPASMDLYSFKTAASNINALAKHLGAESIILGGHDWYV
jgi:hypothetical protein